MRLIFWIGLVAAVVLFLLVVELSRRDVLDRQSFYIAFSLVIGLALVSLLPEIVRVSADLLGLQNTVVFTSTVGILILLFMHFYTLSKVGRLKRKVSNLSQEVAMKHEEE